MCDVEMFPAQHSQMWSYFKINLLLPQASSEQNQIGQNVQCSIKSNPTVSF